MCVTKETNKQIPEDFQDFTNLSYSYENEVLEKANVSVNYKDSCVVYTRVFKIYSNAQNKIAFCDAFTEDYIIRGCKQFVCFSQTPYGEADFEGCKNIDWKDIR